jgi:hypothetical protein
MSIKFVAAVAVLSTVAATVALAQGQAAPKASKAEVQKVVDGIKSDKAKLDQYCEITKLEVQASALAQKNENDPKLKDFDKQADEIAAKLGADYGRIVNSEIDEPSAALFDDLAKSCDIGFQPPQAAPKASKDDVLKLVDGIKSDKAKSADFCQVTKLQIEADALAQKNDNDPKLKELGQHINEIAAKLGPDYGRVVTSEMDEASGALLDGLAKSCK